MERNDRILVVDDDPDIRGLLAEYLGGQGLRADCAAEGRQMRAALRAGPVDLVVLDLMLPGEDGLSLLRWLRDSEWAHLPVLMLTARGDNVDRIIGLEMGADDYIPKPFEPRELVARIRAVLRRTRALPSSAGSSEDDAPCLTFGSWRLDTVARHLVDARGAVTPLSGAEYALLRFLLRHPQRIVSRDQLLAQLAGRDAEVYDRSIDLRVSRLRRRLGDDAREPAYIKTVRNEGYVFCMAVTPCAKATR
ncbi:response regulator [Hylemonella sp. W303a]|uniref:response regulator n=1 Tax=Hylemonella sp. W303a TaxID=3389873 RepID=UPI00396B17EA